MSSGSSRVLIYEPGTLQCELLATGLKSLQRGIEIRCVHDMESLITLLKADSRWVIIISDTGKNGTTISLARHLRAEFPGLPFVFLLPEGRSDRLIEAFRTGAKGVIYSNDDLSQLAKCVHHVFHGEVWARRSELGMIFEGLLSSGMRMADVMGRPLLSAREEEISGLVAEGMTNREISHSLKISESTVKNSLFHIFEKLGISNRVELTRYVNGASEQGGRSDSMHHLKSNHASH